MTSRVCERVCVCPFVFVHACVHVCRINAPPAAAAAAAAAPPPRGDPSPALPLPIQAQPSVR